MKKLQSFVVYALAAPALVLGAGSALAQPSAGLDSDRSSLLAQYDQGAKKSAPGATQSEGKRQDGHSNSRNAMDRGNSQGQSGEKHRGHMNTTPVNGTHASALMGMEVKTTDGEKVGAVDDLIINENGHVVAIVVGIGGFLGMGEKSVAIGWDHVSKSGPSDDEELHVDVSRKDLKSAPEFEKRD